MGRLADKQSSENSKTEDSAILRKKKPSPFFQAKLTVGSTDDAFEREADTIAEKVMRKEDDEHVQPKISPLAVQRMSDEEEDHLQRKGNGVESEQEAPAIVSETLSGGGGRSMDENTQTFMEDRFGQDFSDVKIHTDRNAAKSADSINALAYTSGHDIVFNNGKYAPETENGKKLLAHELTHTIQQTGTVQPYRSKKAFNFAKSDTKSLKEDSFDKKKDKEKKPWIESITVDLKTQEEDSKKHHMWVGTAVAKYYDNKHKLSNITFKVAAGSPELGTTDGGNFTVHRIEGIGYNSGSNSGTAGVDYDESNREGPDSRYSKDLSANMSYAVFYNGGEALHSGPPDASSHGCVHVDWNSTEMQQINYHSVIGLTKVHIKYPKKKKKKKRGRRRRK